MKLAIAVAAIFSRGVAIFWYRAALAGGVIFRDAARSTGSAPPSRLGQP